jgi:hypothetical protein
MKDRKYQVKDFASNLIPQTSNITGEFHEHLG